MEAAGQEKINSYAHQLTHIALTRIDNIELLKDIIKFISFYKKRVVTKKQWMMFLKMSWNKQRRII